MKSRESIIEMKNLRILRKNKKITMKQLGKDIGVSESTISLYETGQRDPDNATVIKLADYFGVTVDYLLGRSGASSPVMMSSSYTPDALVQFPVIGSIKAGYDGQVEEFGTGEYITLPIEMLNGRPAGDYLVFQVRGNSMYPKLLDGDKVLVLRTDSVDSGTTAVISYNGDEATIKKVVYKEGEDWLDLIPANPEYETKHISGSDLEFCHVIGKAVKLIRDI